MNGEKAVNGIKNSSIYLISLTQALRNSTHADLAMLLCTFHSARLRFDLTLPREVRKEW